MTYKWIYFSSCGILGAELIDKAQGSYCSCPQMRGGVSPDHPYLAHHIPYFTLLSVPVMMLVSFWLSLRDSWTEPWTLTMCCRVYKDEWYGVLGPKVSPAWGGGLRSPKTARSHVMQPRKYPDCGGQARLGGVGLGVVREDPEFRQQIDARCGGAHCRSQGGCRNRVVFMLSWVPSPPPWEETSALCAETQPESRGPWCFCREPLDLSSSSKIT